MKFRNRFKLAALAAAALCSGAAYANSTTSQPNILLILTDDHGYGDVGFNGSKDLKTPNLDQLAANGTIFSSAYMTHPFCGPSRAALLTGRYPHKIGAQFNLPTTWSDAGVSTDEPFISTTLQQAGYYTGAIGKWHLGEAEKYHPNNRGFDEFYGMIGGGHFYFPSEYRPRYEAMVKEGVRTFHNYLRPLEHNGKEVRETEYLTDAFSREAETFIRKADQKGKPFFLYLAYNAPHAPMEAKKEDMAQFPHIKNKKRKTIAGMIYAVDRGVKRVVDTLKDLDQLDNTLIVFLSDNGGKIKTGASNYPLRGEKGSAFEGGTRVPMFVHWPKVIPANKRVAHPVLALDLYPTFANIAKAKLPAGKELDGKDIMQNMIDGTDAHKDESFFVLRHRTGQHEVSVHRNEWKAVKMPNKPWSLFNIEQDISETKDLSQKYPVILKNLINDAGKWVWTNEEPRWFHIHEEGDLWRQHNMPRWGETFNLEVESH